MNGTNSWSISNDEIIFEKKNSFTESKEKIPLITLLRVRNEELVIEDTLEHLSSFSDLIIAYDDSSTDKTLEILKSHPKVSLIIENKKWLPGIQDRLISETRHRGLMLQEARKRWDFRWCMCCDADERYIGKISELVNDNNSDEQVNCVRIKLFDAYITTNDNSPYERGTKLLNFRKYFGPERRDILMLWKNSENVRYIGSDSREPHIPNPIYSPHIIYCQHYGKSLSIEHWEATCDYYINHFPYEPYGKKWMARKGLAIHLKSDFDRRLFSWNDELFQSAITSF